MANFTSSISQFNPYIPTIPVQANTKVGVFKQEQYEKGLERISKLTNGIADLPVDSKYKDYINTKLSDIKKQVSSTVSGDLSNTRVVNYITNSASKIAKGPIIRNAIVSTANMRKAESEAEKARTVSGGKYYSPSNAALLQSQINTWRNSDNLSTPFTAQYVPYSDYNQHVLDALKQAGIQTTEHPYTTDSNGNLIINPAILRESGLSRERVQSIVDSALTEADKKQLAIDGWYNYRGMDVEAMKNLMSNKYSLQIKKLNNILSTKQNVDTKFNPNDIKYQNKLTSEIKDIKDRIAALTSQKEGLDSIINSSNLDTFKGNLYTTLYRNNLINAYSTNSIEFDANPIANYNLQKRRVDLQYAKFKADQLEKAYEKSQGDKKEKTGIKLSGGGAAGKIPPAPEDIINNYKTGLDIQSRGIEELKARIKKSHNLTDSELEQVIIRYQNGNIPSSFLAKDILNLVYELNDYNRRNSILESQQKTLSEKIKKGLPELYDKVEGWQSHYRHYSGKELVQFYKEMEDHRHDVYAQVKLKQQEKKEKGLPFTKVDYRDESTYMYSAYAKTHPFIPTTEKGKELYHYYYNEVHPALLRKITEISKLKGKLKNKTLESMADDIRTKLSSKQYGFWPIDTNTPEERKMVSSTLSSYLISRTTEGNGEGLEKSVGGRNFKKEQAEKMLTDPNTKYIFANENGQYYYILSNAAIGDDNFIPATKKIVERLTPNFISDKGEIKDYYLDQLRLGGGFTTNVNDNPLFTFSSFTNLHHQTDTKYHVEADIIKGATGDNYAIKLYVKDANNPDLGVKEITIDPTEAPLTKENLNTIAKRLAIITPEMITKLLYGD